MLELSLNVTATPLEGRDHLRVAQAVLKKVMAYRRIPGPQAACALPCHPCQRPHLAKMTASVRDRRPITFVLPAFPGKSPNLAKVLGVLPDMAERHALAFLQTLCDQIESFYSPGARVVLCSDGRVFSDAVGLRDEDVTAYQQELKRIISESGFTSLSTFDLDDLYRGLSFEQMRLRLMEQYGEPIETLKEAVRRGAKPDACGADDHEANRLYCGITRFLVEDALTPGQTKSRTAIQKECRTRAYTVIQRSKAWGDWVEAQFPEAVRLSIHPQACGAKKIGIRLVGNESWLTPWHAVAVEIGEDVVLMKRAEAEALGGRLIFADGRPSHYVLTEATREA